MKVIKVIAILVVVFLSYWLGSHAALEKVKQYENASAYRQAHYEKAMNQSVTFSDGTAFELKDVSQDGEHIRIWAQVQASSTQPKRWDPNLKVKLADKGHSMFLYNGPKTFLRLTETIVGWEGVVSRLTGTETLQLEVNYRERKGDKWGDEEITVLNIPNPQLHYSLYRSNQVFLAGWTSEGGYDRTTTTIYKEKGKGAE